MRALILAFLITIAPAAHAQRAQVQGSQQVVLARVLQIQPVQIEQRRTNTGSNLGRQVGSQISREAGGGNYGLNQIAGTIGQSIGQGVHNQIGSRGVEIFVRDERGRTHAIVQQGQTRIQPGDTVAIVGSGRNIRVVPMAQR